MGAPAEAPDAAPERYVQERLLGQGGMSAVYLVRDRETGEQLALKKLRARSERSLERLTRQRSQLPAGGFGAYHAVHMLAVGYAANAAGRHEWGRASFDADLRRFERSPVPHSGALRTAALHYGSNLWLGEFVAGDRRDQRLSQRVRRKTPQALRTARDGTYKSFQLRLMRARLHWLDGEEPRAIELLRALLASPRSYGTEYARYALGRLLGGSEGMLLRREAESELREEGVVNPARVLTTRYPEFTEIGRP